MRVAIYARVSSERQDVDLSISAQVKALREHASRDEHTIVREYVDEAESGRSIDRPGFKQMIATARQKPPPFEAILVWKLSRFARNREDSIIYKSLLRRQGIGVVSINEPVEDTPSGRLLEGIIEVIDEFYSANLAQDVVRGMKENASRGFRNGGRSPYGYRRVKVQDGPALRTKLEADPQEAAIVRRIFQECLLGKGLKTIARSLNADGLTTRSGGKWGASSVEKALRNEACSGVMVWDRRRKRQAGVGQACLRAEGAWAAIVDQETFARAQRALASRAARSVHPRSVDSPYLLSGLIRCGRCQAAMVGTGTPPYQYYMCGTARRKGREVCPAPPLRKDRLERFVVDRIRGYVLTDDNLEELVRLTNQELAHSCQEHQDRLQWLQAQLADVENRLENLYGALETGGFRRADLAPRIAALLGKKEHLQQARAEAEDTLRGCSQDILNPQTVRAYVDDLRGLLERSSLMEQRGFLKSFVEGIEVGDSELRVLYAIPVPPVSSREETVGVLPFAPHGEPDES